MSAVDTEQTARPSASASRSSARRESRKLAQRGLSFGAKSPRPAATAVGAATLGALIALWWALSATQTVSTLFLPTPLEVGAKLVELASNGTLFADARMSLYRMAVAFLISSAVAVPLGTVAGSYGFWGAAIEPLMDFVRYMPVVAFVPLTILWFGTDDAQKFVIVGIGTFFQQVLMVMDVVKRVPPEFIAFGRTLGLPGRRILMRIVLPFSLPGIWDVLRVSLGWAWTWLVLAELVAADSGLGYRIVVSQRYLQTDTIMAYILVLGVLGLVADQLMRALECRLFPYAKGAR